MERLPQREGHCNQHYLKAHTPENIKLSEAPMDAAIGRSTGKSVVRRVVQSHVVGVR